MSDPSDPPVHHLDELLAGYVDGSATPEERLAVEAHTSTCATCREEVALATGARVALAGLPEVEPPGIAREGVAGLTRRGLRPVPSAGRPATDRRGTARARRLKWVPALAAAAAVIAVAGLVLPQVLRTAGGSKSSTEAGVPHPAASPSSLLPLLVERGSDYGANSLNALAATLRPAGRSALRAPAPSPVFGGQAAPGAVASDAAERDASQAALTCLRSGGGLEDTATPVYLEAADYQGTPAYVGAFVRPNAKLNFVLVAVSRDACQPLYSLTQSV